MQETIRSNGVLLVAGILAGVVLTLTLQHPPSWACGEKQDPVAPSLAGDLNGDGGVSVADAVHLLNFLFRRGPAPKLNCPESCDGDCLGRGDPERYFPKNLGVSTVVVVRHAEKGAGADPGLIDAGKTRARRLATILSTAPVDHLIASTLRRTRETLEPLAACHDLPIEEIMEAPAVVKRLKNLPADSLAVVAHHSFTIHDILEGLGLPEVRSIAVGGNVFDTFLVVLRAPGRDPQLVELSY